MARTEGPWTVETPSNPPGAPVHRRGQVCTFAPACGGFEDVRYSICAAFGTIKTKGASLMKQQLQASAYHLKPPEIRKLIIAAPNFRDRCVIKTLYWLGLRRQELVNLDVRDLDFGRKRVTVRQGKGSKTRIVPMIDDESLLTG
jgi:hypothetical protein